MFYISVCPKETIGLVIDVQYYPHIFVEIVNKDCDYEMFGYSVDELELIKQLWQNVYMTNKQSLKSKV